MYIFNLLKIIHPRLSISKKSILIMNSFIYDVFERLATEASRLVRLNKRSTMTSNEIQTAVRLVLGRQCGLSKLAILAGVKALKKYTDSGTWYFNLVYFYIFDTCFIILQFMRILNIFKIAASDVLIITREKLIVKLFSTSLI